MGILTVDMIVLPKDYEKHHRQLGNKALNLKQLQKLGLKVPSFLSIPAEHTEEFFSQKKRAEETCQRIQKELPCKSYAIRSSALVEDSQQESFAGQFHTELNAKPTELPNAIRSVLKQAQERGQDLRKVSVIIQEFIEPDLAGVSFTRNPNGEREMVIEYHQGRGEDLVSGRIKATQIKRYWQESTSSNLPGGMEHFEVLRKIEEHFKAPQDVEWCIKDGVWYYLQARPITTIDQDEYKQLKTLDELLDKEKGAFYYQKTEISEIAPRPTSTTLSLLKRIYGKGGPIEKVYRKKGIEYRDTAFLKILGNELYVDREKELQSLLPSYSLLNSKSYKERWSFLKGSWKTLKNLYRLATLKADPIKLREKLKLALGYEETGPSFEAALQQFLKDYELIFEINLCAGLAFKRGEKTTRGNGISWGEFMVLPKEDFLANEEICTVWQPPKDIKGGSLELSDQSRFHPSQHNKKKTVKSASWQQLSEWKKKLYHNVVREGLLWQELREVGRWLTIKNLHQIRKALQKVQSGKVTYFYTLEELLGEKSERNAKRRREEYDRYSSFTFPPKITDHYSSKEEEGPKGISAGKAEGVLVSKDLLKKTKGKKILYAETLEPQLTQCFSQIEGIISQQGSYLSHLAIIAREKGLPVVSNCNLKKMGLQIGNHLQIDGGTGSITINPLPADNKPGSK